MATRQGSSSNPAASDKEVISKRLAQSPRGSVAQFRTADGIAAILAGDANADLKRILVDEKVGGVIDSGYAVLESLSPTKEWMTLPEPIRRPVQTSMCTIVSASLTNSSTLNSNPGSRILEFNVDYVEPMQFSVGKDVEAFVFPAMASELVKLQGISDVTDSRAWCVDPVIRDWNPDQGDPISCKKIRCKRKLDEVDR